MSGADFTIRPSRDDDLPAITAIYRHHVLNGVASFEEVPPDRQEIARRRGEIVARGLPYLVAENGRAICRAGSDPQLSRSYLLQSGDTGRRRTAARGDR